MIIGKAKDCLYAVNGKLLQGSETVIFRGVSINSRTVKEGELFVCIKGENFDGHDFFGDAFRKGAAGIILSDTKNLSTGMLGKGKSPFVIQSENTLRALQDLASYQRSLFPFRVIAVTGTNGKSTTAKILFDILKNQKFDVRLTGNIGNPILSEKKITSKTIFVIEASSYQIEYSKKFKANYALILNISPDHLERHKVTASR